MWEMVEGETGRWQDLKNTATGEHSVKKHKLRKVWEACTDHYFIEEGNSRTVKCNKCGFGKRYVLGMQKLVDGKLVSIKE